MATSHSGQFKWILRDDYGPLASSNYTTFVYDNYSISSPLPSSILSNVDTTQLGIVNSKTYLDVYILNFHNTLAGTGTYLGYDNAYIYTVELEYPDSNQLSLFIGKPCGQVLHCSGDISQSPIGTWVNTNGLSTDLSSHIDETIPGYNYHPNDNFCMFDYNRIYQSGNITLPEFLFTNDGSIIRRWSLETSGLLNKYTNIANTRAIAADPVYKNFYYESGNYLAISDYQGNNVWVNSNSGTNRRIVLDTQRNLIKTTGKYSNIDIGKDYTLYCDSDSDSYFTPIGNIIASDFNPKTNSWYYISDGVDFSPLTCIAYAPDNIKIATGRFDGKINISNSITKLNLLTLSSHTSEIIAIKYNKSGTRLVSSSADTTVKVWDVSTGNLLLTFVGHTSAVVGVAFSPDGTRVASASLDGTLQIWDPITGQLFLSIGNGIAPVLDVVFNDSGNTIISANGGNGFARAYKVINGSILYTLSHPASDLSVLSVDYNSFANRIASLGAGDNNGSNIKIWNYTTGALLLTINTGVFNTRRIHYNNFGTRILVSGSDGSGNNIVKIFDSITGAELIKLTGHTSMVVEAVFTNVIGTSPDYRIASCSFDKTVRTYTGNNGVLILSYSPGLGSTNIRKFDGAYLTDSIVANITDINRLVYCDINNTLYYSKDTSNNIFQYKNATESTLITNSTTYDKPVDFAIDASRNRLYWSNVSGYINYSSLSGTNITVFTQNSGFNPPFIALDCQNGGITFQSKAKFQLEDIASGIGTSYEQQFSMAWTTLVYETSNHPGNISGNISISGVFDMFKSQIYLPPNSGKIWEPVYYSGDKRLFEAVPVNKKYYYQNSPSSGVTHIGVSGYLDSVPSAPYYSKIYSENNSWSAWNSGFLQLEVTSFNLPYNSGNSKIHTVEVVGNNCIWPNFGQLITNALNLYIQGPLPVTSGIDLILSGVIPVNSGLTLYIENWAINNNFPLFIGGPTFSGINNLQLFMLGPQSGTESGNFSLYIQGGTVFSGNQDLFIGGTGTLIPSSGLFSLFLMTDTPSGDMPLFIQGFGDSLSGNLSLYTFSLSSTSSGLQNQFPIFISADINTNLPFFISSPVSGLYNSNLPFYTSASYSGLINSLALFVQNSNVNMNSGVNLFLKAKDDGLYGSLVNDNNFPLYIARDSESLSYWFPMMLQGPSGLNNNFSMYTVGANIINSGFDMYMSGIGRINNSFTLWGHGF